MAIEEHRVPSPGGADEGVIGAVIDALFTPSFLSDRRIVVLRGAENLDATQVGELATRLGEPFEPNVLVLALVGKLPASLAKAVKAKSREIETSPGSSGKARTQWLTEQLQPSPVHLEPGRPATAGAAPGRGRVAPACALGPARRPRTAKVGD